MDVHKLILNLELMSYNKELIRDTVNNYAKTLNSGNSIEVSSFYSEDALFMPEGLKELSKNEIGKKGKFLKKSDFKIQYNSIKVTLDESFAFVNAIAETNEKDLKNGTVIRKTSRDFFVFKKEAKEWKICRYVFNNVKIM